MKIYRAYRSIIAGWGLQKLTVYVYIVTFECTLFVRFCKSFWLQCIDYVHLQCNACKYLFSLFWVKLLTRYLPV